VCDCSPPATRRSRRDGESAEVLTPISLDITAAAWVYWALTRGIRVERPEDIAGAAGRSSWRPLRTACPEGVGWPRTGVLDVLTDPEVPTLPPHIELGQARKLTAAMLKGDAHGPQMIKQGLKDKLVEHLPRS
jgi:pyruvate dehydrogenase (quinone)